MSTVVVIGNLRSEGIESLYRRLPNILGTRAYSLKFKLKGVDVYEHPDDVEYTGSDSILNMMKTSVWMRTTITIQFGFEDSIQASALTEIDELFDEFGESTEIYREGKRQKPNDAMEPYERTLHAAFKGNPVSAYDVVCAFSEFEEELGSTSSLLIESRALYEQYCEQEYKGSAVHCMYEYMLVKTWKNLRDLMDTKSQENADEHVVSSVIGLGFVRDACRFVCKTMGEKHPHLRIYTAEDLDVVD